MDDRALVALCAQGDEGGWLTLIERYDRRILRLLSRNCAREDVEDLRQEVYSRLLTKDRAALLRFRGEHGGSLTLLIGQIAKNVALDHVRARRPLAATEELTAAHHETLASDEPSPERRVDELRWARCLSAALDLVAAASEHPGRDRDILRLHYEEGLAVPEISEMGLGLEHDGIESMLRRTRDKVHAAAAAQMRGPPEELDGPGPEDP
jgi:RNA polymerase sigma factor (sigma-70 family)